MRSISATLPTSPFSNSTLRPAAFTLAATASAPRLSSNQFTATSAPASASATAIAAPMPCCAPVTSATFPSRRIRNSSDDLLRLEVGDLGGTVAQPCQNRAVMFAQLRRDAGLRGRLGESPWRAVYFELSVLGMLDMRHVAVGDHVGIVRRFEHRVDRRRDDVRAAQFRHP